MKTKDKNLQRLLTSLLGAVLCCMPATTYASSWDPSILINTESFLTFEEGDGTSDIELRFGDTVNEVIKWDRASDFFRLTDDVHVEENISSSGALTMSGGAVFNAFSSDQNDVRILGDDENYLLFADADLDTVNVASSSGAFTFTVGGSIGTSETSTLETTSLSLQEITTADNDGSASAVAIGADGLPIIASYNTSDTDISITVCGNADCTTGNTTKQITSGDNIGQFSSIAIGNDGLPVIASYDATNGDLMISKCTDRECNNFINTPVADAGGDTIGQYAAIAIGNDGLPVIAYYNATDTDVMVTKCGNADCSAGNITNQLTNADDVGTVIDIAIGSDGLPVLAYANMTNFDLQFTKCGDASCSSKNTSQQFATADFNGNYPSIAIGLDGYPIIAHQNIVTGDVVVTKCNALDCSSETTTTISDVDNVGEGTSITIGHDGLPIISYYNSTDTDLMVMKCSTPSCSALLSNTNIEDADNIGNDSSIVMSPDGLPIITHQNTTANDLVITRCADETCTGTGSTHATGGNDLGAESVPFRTTYTRNVVNPNPDESLTFGTNNIIRGEFTSSGHFVPGTNGIYDLGSPGTQWNNVYLSGSISASNIRLPDLTSCPAIDTDANGNLFCNWDSAKIIDIFNGTTMEGIDVTICADDQCTTDNNDVKLRIEKIGGGDLKIKFSSGLAAIDTTPTREISLVNGSDTSPTLNFVYILESTNDFEVSTIGFPTAEHSPIATVIVQSVATVKSSGVYQLNVRSDHITNTELQGHVTHINEWIRNQHATYIRGIAQTTTITTNAGSVDDINFATSQGIVLQIHEEIFPAFDTAGTGTLYITNYSGTPYLPITNLNQANEIDDGTTLTDGQSFSLVIWGSIGANPLDNKMFVNLPSCTYTNDILAQRDVDKCSNYSIPRDFVGAGFLISRLTLRYNSADNGTWVLLQEDDLRGQLPSLFAGGSQPAATEFADNTFSLFDEIDSTKIGRVTLTDLPTNSDITLNWATESGTIITSEQSDSRFVDVNGDTMTGQLIMGEGAGITASGSITTETNITLNADAQATDVVLTFGSDGTNETLTWDNANDLFTFSDDVSVVGTLSGSTLVASNLKNCNSIDTDANGNLVCGIDSGAEAGISKVEGSLFYVDVGGDTMTGQLIMGEGAGITASGSITTETNITLNADAEATDVVLTFGSDGTNETLTWDNANDLFVFSDDVSVVGNLSGSTLAASNLINCDSIDTDANGNLVCGIDSGAGGSSIAEARPIFVEQDGDTMTGQLIMGEGAGITASGSITTETNITLNADAEATDVVLTFGSDGTNETLTWDNANDLFTFSDDVSVVGTLSGSTLVASNLKNCNSIDTDANGNLVCGTDEGLTNIDSIYVNSAGDTMTGQLTIGNGAGLTSSGVISTESGLILDANNDNANVSISFGDNLTHALSYIRADSEFSLTDPLTVNGGITSLGTLSGNAITIPALANCTVIEANSSGAFVCVEGGAEEPTISNANLATVQARRDNDLTLAALNTWYDVEYNLTDIESNVNTIKHDVANTERINILETGFYIVTYHVNANNASVTHELHARVRINGGYTLTGSLTIGRNYQNEYSPNISTNIAFLSAGDYITLNVQRTTANTIIDETVLTIVKLDGVRGPKGEKGEPGDGQGLAGMFDAYDSTGGQSTAATVTVNIDTTREISSHFSLASDVITFNNTGAYSVTFSFTSDGTSNTRSETRAWLEQDTGGGFSEIAGSRCYVYNRDSSDGKNTCTRSIILSPDIGDDIRLRAASEDGETNNTVAEGSSITILKIQ